MRIGAPLIAIVFGVFVVILASSTLSLVYMDSMCESRIDSRVKELRFKNKKLLQSLKSAEEKNSRLSQRLTDLDRENRKIKMKLNSNTNTNSDSTVRTNDKSIKSYDKEKEKDRNDEEIAVIVFCYNRAEYLRKALDSLLSQTQATGFKIYVSQDSGLDNVLHPDVSKVIEEYVSRGAVTHLKHIDPSPIEMSPEDVQIPGYYAISRHYKFGLSHLFDTLKYKFVVCFEDDLEAAPDFFSLMRLGSQLLARDPSLLCVSGFNDQGKPEHVRDARQLYRSDYFPGLGFMLSSSLWGELSEKWPKAFWDDWLREPQQRKDRQCIYPEVSRTITFGVQGVSQGQFFSDHLANVHLNGEPVDFAGNGYGNAEYEYLKKDKYDEFMAKIMSDNTRVISSTTELKTELDRISGPDPKAQQQQQSSLVFYYNSLDELLQVSEFVKPELMKDPKAGVFRGAYKGIVSVWQGNHRVFFAPKK